MKNFNKRIEALVVSVLFILAAFPLTLFMAPSVEAAGNFVESSKVSVAGDVSAISLKAGESVTKYLATVPAGSVQLQLGCGYCPSEEGCGPDCIDDWGYCSCTSEFATRTPYLELVSTGDAAVATATLSGGTLQVTANSAATPGATTQIQVRTLIDAPSPQYAANQPNHYGRMSAVVSIPVTIAESAPAAPANLRAEAGDTQVVLNWDAVGNATGYKVAYKAAGAASWTDAGTTAAATYTATGLANGISYEFSVIATNVAGDSAAATVSATPKAAVVKPAAPVNLKAVAGDKKVTLSWDTIAGVESYGVSYKLKSSDTWSFVAMSMTNSYEVTGLTNDSAYDFRVVGNNVAGEGIPAEVSATPKASIPVLVEYTVRFRDESTIISEVKVKAGEAAPEPTAPEKVGYVFTGWDKDFSSVTSDMTVNAVYIKLPEASFANGSKHVKGGGTGLTLNIDKDISLLSSIQIDGIDVPAGAVEVTSGSTIIKILPQYLNSLSAGVHLIKANFEDGTWVLAAFSVENITPVTPNRNTPGGNTPGGVKPGQVISQGGINKTVFPVRGVLPRTGGTILPYVLLMASAAVMISYGVYKKTPGQLKKTVKNDRDH